MPFAINFSVALTEEVESSPHVSPPLPQSDLTVWLVSDTRCKCRFFSSFPNEAEWRCVSSEPRPSRGCARFLLLYCSSAITVRWRASYPAGRWDILATELRWLLSPAQPSLSQPEARLPQKSEPAQPKSAADLMAIFVSNKYLHCAIEVFAVVGIQQKLADKPLHPQIWQLSRNLANHPCLPSMSFS